MYHESFVDKTNNNRKSNINYRPYNDYAIDEIQPVVNRLKLINFAMRENKKNVLITNLDKIATNTKEINECELLRIKYDVIKIDNKISSKGVSITQYFTRHSEKIAAIIDEFESSLSNLLQLKPYHNKISKLRLPNK